MKKRVLFMVFFGLLIFSTLGSAPRATIDLQIKVFVCSEDNYMVRYTVRNTFTYVKNPSIAFKVVKGDEVIACERVSLTLPPGDDGSEIREINMAAPCFQDEKVSLKFRVFPRVVQNKAGPWLSNCP